MASAKVERGIGQRTYVTGIEERDEDAEELELGKCEGDKSMTEHSPRPYFRTRRVVAGGPRRWLSCRALLRRYCKIMRTAFIQPPIMYSR